MITRIEIDGFKSLQAFALDLEPFTALIGPNGAGKSNILDALGLLSRIARGDLATAFRGGRGRLHEQFSHLDDSVRRDPGFGTMGTIQLAVEVLLVKSNVRAGLGVEVSLQSTRLRYEVTIELQLTLGVEVERLAVRRERLLCIAPESDTWMAAHSYLSGFARYSEKKGEIFTFGEQGSELTVDDPIALDALAKTVTNSKTATVQYVPQTAFLAEPSSWFESPHLRALAEELRDMHLIHLEPRLLREPGERGASAVLAADGSNLPTTLRSLAPDLLAQVRADLAGLIPGVRTVNILEDQDMLQIEVEFSDGRLFSARTLSDGTLRVLALITLLRSSAPGRTTAIEEPENGIHPARTRALVEKLVEVTSGSVQPAEEPALPPGSPRQVLITSHSPAVLAALMDYPESITLIDLIRQGDGPRISRARRMARDGDGENNRGRYRVSWGEIQRILETAKPNPAEPEP